MRTNTITERIALNPQRQVKPILFWECWTKKTDGSRGVLVDQNNSGPLLRHKYGKVHFLYFAVR